MSRPKIILTIIDGALRLAESEVDAEIVVRDFDNPDDWGSDFGVIRKDLHGDEYQERQVT